MALFKSFSALCAVLVLAGCADPKIVGLCPPYVAYSRQDQHMLLSELQAGKAAQVPQSQTYRFLRDYAKERAALQVICKGK
ncbi:hypothetical protein GT348_07135 [Aristophania vespae]|uniref:Lipoprotein n=1 Tax=Aristophania vespae TaxID=2697033 RepID=A0A6P1NGK9_9PROT|nr:hypothetical protein [Aristophania vespae]QHI96037.1 hypothetical protein GT348_07135 [Aristophania vespae]